MKHIALTPPRTVLIPELYSIGHLLQCHLIQFIASHWSTGFSYLCAGLHKQPGVHPENRSGALRSDEFQVHASTGAGVTHKAPIRGSSGEIEKGISPFYQPIAPTYSEQVTPKGLLKWTVLALAYGRDSRYHILLQDFPSPSPNPPHSNMPPQISSTVEGVS